MPPGSSIDPSFGGLHGAWAATRRRPPTAALLLAISVISPFSASAQRAEPAAPKLFEEDRDGLPGASVGPSRAEIEALIKSIGRDPVSDDLVNRIDSLFRPRWASQRKFEDAKARVADRAFLATMDRLSNELAKKPADTRALVFRAVSHTAEAPVEELREAFRDDMEREGGEWKMLKGRVMVEGVGGKPIAGAVVASISGTLARTDAKGTFTLKSRIPKGGIPLIITVDAPGYALTQYGFAWNDLKDGQSEVFRIPPAVAFGGRVVDPKGKPIAGAELDLWIAQEAICRDGSLAQNNFAGLIIMKSRTDAEGRYAFRGVPPELEGHQAASSFVVTHPKFEARSKQYAPNEWLGPGWEITMDPGCMLAGIVTDDDGKPVAGASVQAVFNGPAGVYPTASTDAQGKFLLEGLPVSAMNLVVKPVDHLAVNSQVTTRKDEVVELKLTAPKGEHITGKVLNSDGKPAARAQVSWTLAPGPRALPQRGRPLPNRTTNTNDDGTFRLGPMAKGRYKVTAVIGAPLSIATVEAEAGDKDLVIELKPDPNER